MENPKKNLKSQKTARKSNPGLGLAAEARNRRRSTPRIVNLMFGLGVARSILV